MADDSTLSSGLGHVPVLQDRVVGLLAPALCVPGAVYVDATLGLGGHAQAVLQQVPTCRIIGIDRDTQALSRAQEVLAPWSDQVTLIHAVYDELPRILDDLGIDFVQGILFDLGVSSMQLDRVDRGFSYSQDAPLDMRMNPGSGDTAADILNSYTVPELTRVLRDYGDEKFARRIAQRIVAQREVQTWTTSGPLVELIRSAIPAPARRTGGNPAKRTFQALRIEVNDELGVLQAAIPAALSVLALHGRLVVMSYQSLEDKIVKSALRPGLHPDVPHGLPVIPDELMPWLQDLSRGSITAGEQEIEHNPRASSVRVRAVERVAA
ncbi:MAG: 16S rRNA (cytosine(1402)-N(4))-methyltransferase RsmH [Actinomycetes bacterium]